MSKAEDRARWISETQMFQRIAGVLESSDAELGADWDAMKPPHRKRALTNIITHRCIQDMAIAAGKARRN